MYLQYYHITKLLPRKTHYYSIF